MQINRHKLIEDFFLSYRATGQLIIKFLQTTFEDDDQIHFSGLMLLKMLKRHGPQSQNQIAQHLCHSEAAISRQVSIAQEKGLVSVETDPDNRRSSIISLTQEGESVLKVVNNKAIQDLSNILAEIPRDDLERVMKINQQLQELLQNTIKQEVNVRK